MSTRITAVLLLVGLAGCIAGPEHRPDSAGPSRRYAKHEKNLTIPPNMREQVRRSEVIGRQIYVLDKVSAIATDVLMEKVPDFREKNLAGYLPFQEAGDDLRPQASFRVTFYTDDTPIRIAYEVRVKPDVAPELAVFDPPRPALPSFAHFASARQAALAALPSHEQPLNPVVLPADALGEKGMMVYLTDWPLETHVFASLLARKLVYVTTKAGVWRVDGDKIALIEARAPETVSALVCSRPG